ncbi:MAG: hypothetical protein OXD54_08810 [Candidatus Poribacteria bacterium]|nr:hypothetical protein [Candidatus Poribacteria bacterium]
MKPIYLQDVLLPEGMEIPENELDRIMTVSLLVGSSTLIGSDSCSP